MKRLLLTLSIIIFATCCAFSQFTLRTEIKGLRNNKGKIMIQLYDESQKVLVQNIEDITDNGGTFFFRDLKPGKYAVRFYHDENMNRVLDTNLVGKPTEGYGFSNNVTARFSMPPFNKWLFDLNENKTITINAVY